MAFAAGGGGDTSVPDAMEELAYIKSILTEEQKFALAARQRLRSNTALGQGETTNPIRPEDSDPDSDFMVIHYGECNLSTTFSRWLPSCVTNMTRLFVLRRGMLGYAPRSPMDASGLKKSLEIVLENQANHVKTLYLSPNVEIVNLAASGDQSSEYKVHLLRKDWSEVEKSRRLMPWYPYTGDVSASSLDIQFSSRKLAAQWKTLLQHEIKHPNLSLQFYEDTVSDVKITHLDPYTLIETVGDCQKDYFHRLNGCIWKMILTGDESLRTFYFSISEAAKGETHQLTDAPKGKGGADVFNRLVQTSRRISMWDEHVVAYMLYRSSLDTLDRSLLLLFNIEEAVAQFAALTQEQNEEMHFQMALLSAERLNVTGVYLRLIHVFLYRQPKTKTEKDLFDKIRESVLQLLSYPRTSESLDMLSEHEDQPRSLLAWRQVFLWFKLEMGNFRGNVHPSLSLVDLKLMKKSPIWLLHRVLLDIIYHCNKIDSSSLLLYVARPKQPLKRMFLSHRSVNASNRESFAHKSHAHMSPPTDDSVTPRGSESLGFTDSISRLEPPKLLLMRTESLVHYAQEQTDDAELAQIQRLLVEDRKEQVANVIKNLGDDILLQEFYVVKDNVEVKDLHLIAFFFDLPFAERNIIIEKLADGNRLNNEFFRAAVRLGLQLKRSHTLVEVVSVLLFGIQGVSQPCRHEFKKPNRFVKMPHAVAILMEELCIADQERNFNTTRGVDVSDHYLLITFALRFEVYQRAKLNDVVYTFSDWFKNKHEPKRSPAKQEQIEATVTKMLFKGAPFVQFVIEMIKPYVSSVDEGTGIGGSGGLALPGSMKQAQAVRLIFDDDSNRWQILLSRASTEICVAKSEPIEGDGDPGHPQSSDGCWQVLEDNTFYPQQMVTIKPSNDGYGSIVCSGATGNNAMYINGYYSYEEAKEEGKTSFYAKGDITSGVTVDKTTISKGVVEQLLLGILAFSIKTSKDGFPNLFTRFTQAAGGGEAATGAAEDHEPDVFEATVLKNKSLRKEIIDLILGYYPGIGREMADQIKTNPEFLSHSSDFSSNALDCLTINERDARDADIIMVSELVLIALKLGGRKAGIISRIKKLLDVRMVEKERRSRAPDPDVAKEANFQKKLGLKEAQMNLTDLLYAKMTEKLKLLTREELRASSQSFEEVFNCLDVAWKSMLIIKDQPESMLVLQGMFENYIQCQPIEQWNNLFKDSKTVAMFIKLGTREDFDQAFEKFATLNPIDHNKPEEEVAERKKFHRLLNATKLLFCHEPEPKGGVWVGSRRTNGGLQPIITKEEIKETIKPVAAPHPSSQGSSLDASLPPRPPKPYDILMAAMERRKDNIVFTKTAKLQKEDGSIEVVPRPTYRQDMIDAKFAYEMTHAAMEKFNDKIKPQEGDDGPQRIPVCPRNVQLISFLISVRWLREVCMSVDGGGLVGTIRKGFQKAKKAMGGGGGGGDGGGAGEVQRCLVTKVGTGEGKSLIIALISAYVAKQLDPENPFKVHVLENDEGLLAKDYGEFEKFFAGLGIRLGMANSSTKPDTFIKNAGTPREETVEGFKELDKKHVVYLTMRAMQNYYKYLVGKTPSFGDRTVLIVDEVDGLIVDKKPNDLFVKQDSEKSLEMKLALNQLIEHQPDIIDPATNKRGTPSTAYKTRPAGVSIPMWMRIRQAFETLDKKSQGIKGEAGGDYVVDNDENSRGDIYAINKEGERIDDGGTMLWLEILRYKMYIKPPEGQIRGKEWDPMLQSPYFFLSLPHMVRKYNAVLGLSGSLGSSTEKSFLNETYQAWSYDVPSFMNTCGPVELKKKPSFVGNKDSRNAPCHSICETHEQQENEIFELAFEKMKTIPNLEDYDNSSFGVPVLIITDSSAKAVEMTRKMRKRLEDKLASLPVAERNSLLSGVQADGNPNLKDTGEPYVVEDYIQIYTQFQNEFNTKIEDPAVDKIDTTAKIPKESYYAMMRHSTEEMPGLLRVMTITDPLGGRGHDFDVSDENAELAGGMLVIATTVPKPRDWLQWKGRTARSDRSGQIKVILCKQDAPFNAAKSCYAFQYKMRVRCPVAALGEIKEGRIDEVHGDGTYDVLFDNNSKRNGVSSEETGFEPTDPDEYNTAMKMKGIAIPAAREAKIAAEANKTARISNGNDPLLEKLEELHDAGAGEMIAILEEQVALGQRLNELSDKYHETYKQKNGQDGKQENITIWPRVEHKPVDNAFSHFLRSNWNSSTHIEMFKKKWKIAYDSIYPEDLVGLPPKGSKDPVPKRFALVLDWSSSMLWHEFDERARKKVGTTEDEKYLWKEEGYRRARLLDPRLPPPPAPYASTTQASPGRVAVNKWWESCEWLLNKRRINVATKAMSSLLRKHIDNEDSVCFIKFSHKVETLFETAVKGPCGHQAESREQDVLLQMNRGLTEAYGLTAFRAALALALTKFPQRVDEDKDSLFFRKPLEAKKAEGNDVVILLTDGEDSSKDFAETLVPPQFEPGCYTTNSPSEEDLQQRVAASSAKGPGIKTFILGCGAELPDPNKPAVQNYLRQLAVAGGTNYIYCDSAEAVDREFEIIAQSLKPPEEEEVLAD